MVGKQLVLRSLGEGGRTQRKPWALDLATEDTEKFQSFVLNPEDTEEIQNLG